MMDATMDLPMRRDFAPFVAAPTRSGLLREIERLAEEVARRAPEVGAQTDEILGLAASLREAGPSRDSVMEAIENVCGEDLSGCCVSRIADAVMKLCAR